MRASGGSHRDFAIGTDFENGFVFVVVNVKDSVGGMMGSGLVDGAVAGVFVKREFLFWSHGLVGGF
jgi:hypothetical protein